MGVSGEGGVTFQGRIRVEEVLPRGVGGEGNLLSRGVSGEGGVTS